MKTTLAQANAHLRARRYAAALELYARALQERPALARYIEFNMRLAEKRRVLWPESAEIANANEIAIQANRDEHRAYPDTLYGYAIQATHQLTRNTVIPELWDSQGGDPYFILDPSQVFGAEKTWYRLDLRLRTAKRRGAAKLYLDVGAGFNEKDTVTVSFKSGETVKHVFWLDALPKALRFDPKEEPGELEVKAFGVNAISEEAARTEMLEKVMRDDAEFSSHDVEAMWEKVRALAADEKMNPINYLNRIYKRLFIESRDRVTYQEWIEAVEKPSLPAAEEVANFIANVGNAPCISIVMPVYNTPETYLRACIDSVLAQSYPNWELCIADDNSSKVHVRKVLEEYQQKDTRIRVVYREQNGHISRASNSALEIATGEYVALLDHDDTLPEHALYFMAQAIHENPDAHILYSDEDKLDAKGKRFDPHFKSDWNPDLFYSQNYVSHLGVYRCDLLKRIGGFRAGVEGSQDQDLLLRCLPHVTKDQIIHIPRVLYHWRTVEGSTALASGEKSYTTEAGIKSLKDYFTAHGPQGIEVEPGLVPNTYRVIWPLPEPAPLVSLLIPTRDRKTITEVAVRSILEKTTYQNYEIIILDNGSVEKETLAWFDAIQQEDTRVKVIRYDHPFNYSAINNFGVRHAQGSLIGLINNDVEVISPEWLTEMVRHANRKEIGCVGAKLYYSNDTLQHGGVILGIGGVANHSHKHSKRNSPGYFARLIVSQNFSAVTAACLLVRREVYEQVGGLDEENLKIAFNDVDFCLKVREAGYRNLWTPYAELYHHESISRGNEDTPEKQARFRKEVEFMQSKWGDALKLDPYYSPNLTKEREDFSIGSKS